MTDSVGSAIKRTSSRPMFNGNETWTEKDKRIINVKTTRNNLGKLIKCNISVLHSIRFIESDWLRAIMHFQDRAGVYVGGRGGGGGEGKRKYFDTNPRYMAAHNEK